MLRLSGAAELTMPVRFVAAPRARSVLYSLDLDGDGTADWVLENQRVRAVFSGVGCRWMEWEWKDTGTNFLPDAGALAMAEPAKITASDGRLQCTAGRVTRTIGLTADGGSLTIEQNQPLGQSPAPPPRDGITATIDRSSPERAIHTLSRP